MKMIDKNDFNNISKIIHDLLQIQDLDLLLEQILTEIRNIVNSDAGSIYLVDKTILKFTCTQNDTLQRKLPFGKKLIYSNFTLQINNKSIAGYVANTGVLTNIPDAYHLNNIQPYTFDKYFDEKADYRTQSILTLPIKNSSGKVIGVIQLINSLTSEKTIKPFSPTEEAAAQFFTDNIAIAIEHAQIIRTMISHMSKMLELHDPTETITRSNRIAACATEIYESWARKKGLLERTIQHNRSILRMAAMIYNIGKIAIPPEILKKSYEELNQEEIKALQKQVIYGASIFANTSSDFDEIAKTIILDHHENWDGTGYPGHINIEDGNPLSGYAKPDGTAYGKTGKEISIYGQVVAIAELSETTTIDKILTESGKKFDPEVVAAFVGCIDIINSIKTNYPD
jgi:response regulator RpfG family c-di-GMP phosphodiesterase